MTAPASDAVFLDSSFLSFASERGVPFSESLIRLQGKHKYVVDVKTLQEIVYRFHLLDETRRGYECALALRSEAQVLPVTAEDLKLMDLWLDRFPNLRPRELIHLAVMRNNGVSRLICAPGSGYHEFPEIQIERVTADVVSL